VIQPTADEGERLLRGDIGPVGVIHDRDDRALSRRDREETERRGADRERRRTSGRAELEDSLERGRLPKVELVEDAAQRPEQPLEGRERNLLLGLDTGGAQRPPTRISAAGGSEKRGLSDPGLARHEHRAAAPGLGRPAGVDQNGELSLPTQEHDWMIAATPTPVSTA
jgi:hypothetical protein